MHLEDPETVTGAVASLVSDSIISPVVLLVTTLFFSGVLALGPDLGSAAAVDLPEKWDREDHERERRDRLRP